MKAKVPPPVTEMRRCHVCGQEVRAVKHYGWPFVLSAHKGSDLTNDRYGFCRGAGQAAEAPNQPAASRGG